MEQQNSTNKNFAGVGILAALTASLCCITPVLAAVSGIGGIASTFSWMEPLRPYFIGITVLVLGFAWFQQLKPKKDIGCACEEDEKRSFWQSKTYLGSVTVLAVFLLAFPYISWSSAGDFDFDNPDTKYTVKLVDVKGMTCEGCNDAVEMSVGKLKGVKAVKADYTKGQAEVAYDGTVTDLNKVKESINKLGYKAVDQKDKKVKVNYYDKD